MHILFIIGIVLHVATTYGMGSSEGVGSFSYSDSSGRRYGGIYGLKDGKVVNRQGNFPPNFQPPSYEEPNFQDLEFTGDFFPQYFKNLGNILEDSFLRTPFFPPFMHRSQRHPFAMPFRPIPFGVNPPFGIPNFEPFNARAFRASIENQKLALEAARKAFDITSNQANYQNNHGYTAYNDYDVPNVPRFPDIPSSYQGYGDNSAFARSAIGPGFKEQIAAINPNNPENPNIKITRLSDPSRSGYKSVSVSSIASSADINGQKFSNRQASTVIDDNGRVTRYDVRS